MADKMAVMNGGVLQQYDAPQRVFEHPVNTFVAGFVGSPAMNLIPARVATTATGAALESKDGWRCGLSAANARKALTATSPEVVIGARHSTIRLSSEASGGTISGRIYTVEPTGDVTYVHVRLGSDTIIVSVAPDFRLAADQPIEVAFDQEKLHLFDAATGLALTAA